MWYHASDEKIDGRKVEDRAVFWLTRNHIYTLQYGFQFFVENLIWKIFGCSCSVQEPTFRWHLHQILHQEWCFCFKLGPLMDRKPGCQWFHDLFSQKMKRGHLVNDPWIIIAFSSYLVLRFLWLSVGYYDFSRNFWLVSMVCHGSTRPNSIKVRRF